jgi:stage V sporulation protein D (sporulation-specific penicillin-binding protein)
MKKSRISIKKRMLLLMSIFTLIMIALLGKVFWIQVINGEWYRQKAFEQQNRDREISASRGTIFDRNGKELAISASVEMITVNPVELRKSYQDINALSYEFAEILGMDTNQVLKKLNKASRYEVIKRRVDKEVSDKIRKIRKDKKLGGINIDEDNKRYYPNRNLASHIVGFTGEDNQGLAGIELMMEQYLRGVPGKILSEVDAGGREVPFNEEKRIEPQDGLNVVLSIDETIQHFAQKELEKAIEENKVLNGGAVLVMDPRTGDVLALVSKPDFDLNTPKAAPPGIDPSTWKGNTSEDIKILGETVWRNKAVMDTYEPGSTFKAFTSAAGMEEGVVGAETITSDKTITVQGKNINCWKPNAHGTEPFYLGVYNSCNPVFVKVAQSLGIERFYKYMRTFGFYEKTGISLPGEAGSIMHSKPIEIDMAVASFGQRFEITPIQLITGYTALINDGKLMKPRLVKELRNKQGTVVKSFDPEIVRVAISRKTVDSLKSILEGVVSEGTGKNAYVKGYRVAGKTGTSETKEEGHYIASFCGFAPADNPVAIVLVVLDNPRGESYYGGTIAAPVAGRIFEQTLNYLGVDRKYSDKDRENMAEEVYVPDLRGKTLEEASKILRDAGLQFKAEQGAALNIPILDQMPKPGVFIAKKSLVILYTNKDAGELLVTVPDVTGSDVHTAIKILQGSGLNIRVLGVGNATKQSRKPGEQVPKGSLIEVEFKSLDTH